MKAEIYSLTVDGAYHYSEPLELMQDIELEIGEVVSVFMSDDQPNAIPSELLNSANRNNIIENMIEHVYEQYGEYACESWEFNIQDLQKHIDESVNNWFTSKKCMPTFSPLGKVVEIKFRVIELDEYGYVSNIEETEKSES